MNYRGKKQNWPNKMIKTAEVLLRFKKARNVWVSLVMSPLSNCRFKCTEINQMVLICINDSSAILIIVFVDYNIFIGYFVGITCDIKLELFHIFDIKVFRSIGYFIGLDISRIPSKVKCWQTTYANDFIWKPGLWHANKTRNQIPVGF